MGDERWGEVKCSELGSPLLKGGWGDGAYCGKGGTLGGSSEDIHNAARTLQGLPVHRVLAFACVYALIAHTDIYKYLPLHICRMYITSVAMPFTSISSAVASVTIDNACCMCVWVYQHVWAYEFISGVGLRVECAIDSVRGNNSQPVCIILCACVWKNVEKRYHMWKHVLWVDKILALKILLFTFYLLLFFNFM